MAFLKRRLRATLVLVLAAILVSPCYFWNMWAPEGFMHTTFKRAARPESSATLEQIYQCVRSADRADWDSPAQGMMNSDSPHIFERGPKFLRSRASSTRERLLHFSDASIAELERIYDCVSWSKPFPDQFGRDRRPSYPFNSADGFRQLCSHRCEPQGCSFSATDVRSGDCIFVAYTITKSFTTTTAGVKAFASIASEISVPFFVISGSGDISQPDGDNWHQGEPPFWSEKYSFLLDLSNLKAWFASNCHWLPDDKPKPEKIHCIPIGIENRYSSIGSDPRTYFRGMQQDSNRAPSKLLLVDFEPSPVKPWRTAALQALQQDWVTRLSGRVSPADWRKLVRDHKWIACPPGHGYDTHRVWEVLMLGGLPVVPSTTMDSLYEGLPVLIVQDWQHVTAELLHARYEALQSEAWSMDRIFFPYWLSKMVSLGLMPRPDPVYSFFLLLQARNISFR